jgi:hypothetical protein
LFTARRPAKASDGGMHADVFRTGTLSLVRTVRAGVKRYLSGHAEPAATLSWVAGVCRQVRATARDATTLHLVGLIDSAAALLQETHGRAGRCPDSTDDADSADLVLVKALRSLEDHLARLSVVH